MFPNANFTPFFNPFEAFSTQIPPHMDFTNVYLPFQNYPFYQHHPQYFQLNTPLWRFSQSTLIPDTKTSFFQSSQHDQIEQIQNKSLNKNDSSLTIDQKIIYQQKDKLKTKVISKNEKGESMFQTDRRSKQKKQKLQSKFNQQEYSIQEENKKRSEEQLHLFLKYRRKNTESNIVNRIYSFLTSEFKNKNEVLRLGLTDEKKDSYLKYLVQVVEAWKGPVKRQLLHKLINISESLPAYKVLTKMYESERILSLQEFSYLNRVLVRMYLSKIAGVSVVTSKKMKKSVWKQHLQKIRELKEYFFESQENQC